VIDEDLDRLGQLRPGDVIRFREAGADATAWTLRDLVRLARLVIARGAEEFAFEDHATGARLRVVRRRE
jgi:allophanate hydrolase subunit 2